VPQAHIRLQPRAAQVEIAIFQTDFFRHRRVVGDLERRRLGFVENPDVARQQLDFAGGQLRVDRVPGAALDDAGHADDVFRPQLLGHAHQRVVFADDDLRETSPVADVDERDAAEIADAVDPAEKNRFDAHVPDVQGAAGMGASQSA
jgi:hypothetical protein